MTVNHEGFVTIDGQVITLAMDSNPPPGNRTSAVVLLQLIDEMTAKAPTGRITLQVSENGPQPRVSRDGFVGLVGTPVHIFPNLKNQFYFLHLDVQVNGYLRMKFIPQIAQAPTFPAEFTPANLGKIELHTTPSVLRGRVVQVSLAGAVTPVSGATIDVTGFWAKAPTPLANPPATPPNMVAVFPPVYAGRSAAGGVFQRRNMTIVPGQDKILVDLVAAGNHTIVLSDRVGIAPGSVLWIDPTHNERMEMMEIATLSGGSTPLQQATATLTFPLAYDHARNVLVRPINPQPPVFSKSFNRAIYTGDTTLYLNNLSGVVPAMIEISGDGLPSEYHQLQLYTTTSGIDGYFRLPPIHRAAQLILRASRLLPLNKVEFNFSPDYQQYENRVDFVFHP